jgi:hypothetical protein
MFSAGVALAVLHLPAANNVGNVGPDVRQTFLKDVFTFLTEVGNASRIVNTGTSSVNSDSIRDILSVRLSQSPVQFPYAVSQSCSQLGWHWPFYICPAELRRNASGTTTFL